MSARSWEGEYVDLVDQQAELALLQGDVDTARQLAATATETLTTLRQCHEEVTSLAETAQAAATEAYGFYSVEHFQWSNLLEGQQAIQERLRQQQATIDSNPAVREAGDLALAADRVENTYQQLQDAILRRCCSVGSTEEIEQAQERHDAAKGSLQALLERLAGPIDLLCANLAAEVTILSEAREAMALEAVVIEEMDRTLEAYQVQTTRANLVMKQCTAVAHAAQAATDWERAAEKQLQAAENALTDAQQSIEMPQGQPEAATDAQAAAPSCNCDAETAAYLAALLRYEQLESKVMSAMNECDRLEALVAQQEQRVQEAEERLKLAQERLDKAATDLKQRQVEAEKAQAALNAAVAALQKAYESLGYAKGQQDIGAITEAIRACQAAQAAYNTACSTNSTAQYKLGAAQSEYNTASGRKQACEATCRIEREQLKQCQTQLEAALKKYKELEKDLKEASKALNDAADALDKCLRACPRIIREV